MRPGKVVTTGHSAAGGGGGGRGSNSASSPITLDPDSPDQSPDIQDVTDAPPSGSVSFFSC